MKQNAARRSKFTIDDLLLEAKKYSSRSAFVRGSPWAYHAARNRGWLDQICVHMQISTVYSTVRWDQESARAEAKKYNSRAEFKRERSGAYCYLKDQGVLGDACLHMVEGQNHWHVFELRAVSIKYSRPVDFKFGAAAAYVFARKHGLLDMICCHMTKKAEWTRDDAAAEASKHQTIAEFRAAEGGAYKYALRTGILQDICAHMVPATNGFDKVKPATLYYLRIRTATNLVLYKIGITNRSPKSRITGMGLQNVVAIDVIKTFPFASGREARLVEKAYHREFACHAYTGDPVLGNGNTELFTADVLGLCNN